MKAEGLGKLTTNLGVVLFPVVVIIKLLGDDGSHESVQGCRGHRLQWGQVVRFIVICYCLIGYPVCIRVSFDNFEFPQWPELHTSRLPPGVGMAAGASKPSYFRLDTLLRQGHPEIQQRTLHHFIALAHLHVKKGCGKEFPDFYECGGWCGYTKRGAGLIQKAREEGSACLSSDKMTITGVERWARIPVGQ